MISVRCPHCQIGLKVDEAKIPAGISSFKCPNCQQTIPMSLLEKKKSSENVESETIVLNPRQKTLGSITVLADNDTSEQSFPMVEGVSIIGRKSVSASSATIMIETKDRSMSRTHIKLEVVKDEKGGYKHLLSDCNSKNNTLYNSNFLEKNEVVILKDQDVVVLGKTVIRFRK